MSESNITKNALASSLKELMKTKNFEKISVSDICEGCNMNRKSFYYHFRDKYDLLNWIFEIDFLKNVEFKSLMEEDDADVIAGKQQSKVGECVSDGGGEAELPGQSTIYLWKLFEKLTVYFYKEKEFYSRALMIEGQNSFKDYFHDSIFPVISYYLADVVEGTESDFFTAIMCDAFISAIIRWLTDDRPMEPDRFVNEFRGYMIRLGKRLVHDFKDEVYDEK